jgi:hypothetical protein
VLKQGLDLDKLGARSDHGDEGGMLVEAFLLRTAMKMLMG